MRFCFSMKYFGPINRDAISVFFGRVLNHTNTVHAKCQFSGFTGRGAVRVPFCTLFQAK
jgi:hypothetical protein